MKLKSKKALNIFDYVDYRTYLIKWFDLNQDRIRGIRSRFAEAIGCNSPFVSHVLFEKNHLSLEQGLRATRFLNLNAIESRYFMMLIQHQRAGTSELRDYFHKELEELKSKQTQIKSRIGHADRLTPLQEQKYYSHWLNAAVHIAMFIEKYRNPKRLASALRAPEHHVIEALHFLEEAGLVEARGDGTYIGKRPNLHLAQDSPLIQSLHSQWRLRAVRDPLISAEKDVHYSLVLAIAKRDRKKFAELILQTVEKAQKLMSASSPEEELYALTLDFFSITEE